MSDWADDIAKSVYKFALISNSDEETNSYIAAALRKAKADGMREAANRVLNCENGDYLTEVEAIRALAAMLDIKP